MLKPKRLLNKALFYAEIRVTANTRACGCVFLRPRTAVGKKHLAPQSPRAHERPYLTPAGGAILTSSASSLSGEADQHQRGTTSARLTGSHLASLGAEGSPDPCAATTPPGG